jgi:hypothetical protein
MNGYLYKNIIDDSWFQRYLEYIQNTALGGITPQDAAIVLTTRHERRLWIFSEHFVNSFVERKNRIYIEPHRLDFGDSFVGTVFVVELDSGMGFKWLPGVRLTPTKNVLPREVIAGRLCNWWHGWITGVTSDLQPFEIITNYTKCKIVIMEPQ